MNKNKAICVLTFFLVFVSLSWASQELGKFSFFTNMSMVSPLTVSFGENSDYLAGSESWRKQEARAPVLSAMREFDLDGTGAKMWEWVGPKEGILVYNPEGKEDLEVTGKDFFGIVSFGKKWTNGFEPLKTLDKDGNDLLDSQELRELWLWKDLNTDAKVQKGELLPLKTVGITSLSTKFEKDSQGGLLNLFGARTQDKSLAVRDWWSLGGTTRKDYESFLVDVLSTPSLYQWEPVEKQEGVTGGALRFSPADKEVCGFEGIIGYSISLEQAKAENGQEDKQKGERMVTPALAFFVQAVGAGAFGWVVDMGEGKVLVTQVVSDPENVDTLLGVSALVSEPQGAKEPKVEVEYEWRARRVSGPSLNLLLDSFVAFHKKD